MAKLTVSKNTCTFLAFYADHLGVAMQYGAHCPMDEVHDYTVLPRRPPWSSILAQKIEIWRCEIAVSKLAFKIHKTDTLASSSKQQAA
jgi:hypothetical protein